MYNLKLTKDEIRTLKMALHDYEIKRKQELEENNGEVVLFLEKEIHYVENIKNVIKFYERYNESID